MVRCCHGYNWSELFEYKVLWGFESLFKLVDAYYLADDLVDATAARFLIQGSVPWQLGHVVMGNTNTIATAGQVDDGHGNFLWSVAEIEVGVEHVFENEPAEIDHWRRWFVRRQIGVERSQRYPVVKRVQVAQKILKQPNQSSDPRLLKPLDLKLLDADG